LQAVTTFGSPDFYRTQSVSIQEETEALLRAISQDRFTTYLKAAGHDPERALALYLWNAQIGEAFHLPIQAVEVALRNSINAPRRCIWGRLVERQDDRRPA
jgi:hypothetical protein